MSGGVGPVVDWSPAGSRKTAALHGALARMLPARAGQFARSALAFALIALLFHFGAIDAGNVVAVLSSPGILLLAVLGNLVIVHVAIAKWDLLLRLQGVRIPFVRLWRITFIAMFTGSFFPGGVGQDAVRVFCAAREPECSFGQALTSVVADRLLGLTGLLIAATIFVLIKEERVMGTPALRALAIFVFGATMATLVLLGGVAALGYRPSVRRRLRMFLGAKGPAARVIGPLVEAGRAYGDRLWGVLAALAISVIVHLLTASVLILLAETIELRGLGRLDIALATALASLANAIPLTPGGLGIGEGAFAEICRMLSTAPDAGSYGSTFFLARAVTTFVSLIGAVSYVWRSEERTPRQAREYEGVEDRSPCAEADDGRSPSGPHGAGTGSVSLSIDGRVRSSER